MVNVGDNIVATRDQYYTVTKCTVMVVTKDMGDGDVCARIHDGDDNYSWFMPAGSYEPCGDTPTLWRDMTDAEKGALLLAKHEGKGIEQYYPITGWVSYQGSVNPQHAYRVKPTTETRKVWIGPVSGSGMSDVLADVTYVDGHVVSVAWTV